MPASPAFDGSGGRGVVIYGGIISRLVTPNHPGDPALDVPGLEIQMRIEFLADDEQFRNWIEAGRPPDWHEYLTQRDPDCALTWTLVRADAFHYPRHLDAETRAQAIGHCRVTVAADEEQRAENARIQERIWNGDLRAVSASSTGAVKQAESVETIRRDCAKGKHGDAPRPQNKFRRRRAEGGRRNGKSERLEVLRAANERTASADSERFWWKQGAYA